MAVKNWITPANIEKFRVVEAFASLPEIDWRLSAKPDIGDIVYIYLSNDLMYVKFKTVVIATDIKPQDTIDDEIFVTDKGKSELPEVETFTRLRLLQTFADYQIPKSVLTDRGFKGNVQHTRQLPDECVKFLRSFDTTSNFPKGCFAFLIDRCSKGTTTNGSKTAHNVRKVLPLLVKWAKEGRTNGTYNELIKACGYKQYSGFGRVLGVVHDIFTALSKETGEDIPTLNALVTDPKTGLPSNGFFYVSSDYEKLDDEAKRKIVANYNAQAIHYKQWDWVLNLLGLKAAVDSSVIDKIRKGAFGFGGEGEEHKNLKLHIAKHPELVNLKSKSEGETEHILLSGDRLDVFFSDINTAVEVKPSTSPEADILRGIYQCVKYKAILDAEAQHRGVYANNRAILALGGSLTEQTRLAAEILGVTVFENIKDI